MFSTKKKFGRGLLTFLTGCFLYLGIPEFSTGQDGTVGDTDIEIFEIGGSISNETHGYTTTRDANRRAPVGNVTTSNINFSLLGIDSAINLRYNTDESEFRQSINRFGFSGRWRWISLSVGDVSPSWSQYSLSGTRLRGGQLELTPGPFLLELTGGRARRAINPAEENSPGQVSFERMLYGARIGIGDTRHSHFMLSGFYAKDDRASITIPENEEDFFTTRRASPPGENLLISPEFQLSFWNQRIQLGGKSSVSAFTRDLRSDVIDTQETGVPSFITDIMQVHTSTRLGWAGSAFTRLGFNPVDIELAYERYQPGFESLGLRMIRDDQHTYSADVGIELFNRRLRLNNSLSLHEDNLLGQRHSTQTGWDYAVDANVTLTETFSLRGGYNLRTNKREPDQNELEIERATHSNNTHTFRLQPSLYVTRNDNTHTITVSSQYQIMENRIRGLELQRDTDVYTLNTMISYSVALFDGLSLNSSLNGVWSEARGSEINNYGLNAGIGYPMMGGDLSTNFNIGVSRNQINRSDGDLQNSSTSWQLNGNGRLAYRITAASQLQLSIRTNTHHIAKGEGGGFSEFESRLSFNYNF